VCVCVCVCVCACECVSTSMSTHHDIGEKLWQCRAEFNGRDEVPEPTVVHFEQRKVNVNRCAQHLRSVPGHVRVVRWLVGMKIVWSFCQRMQ